MSEYPREPWRYTPDEWEDVFDGDEDMAADPGYPVKSAGLIDADGQSVFTLDLGDFNGLPSATARRIAACVNALAGWQTETVEKYCTDGQPGRPNLGQEFAGLRAQRDTLLAALILARHSIATDRQSLLECETHPVTGEVEPAAQVIVNEYDATLRTIDAAIDNATGEQE